MRQFVDETDRRLASQDRVNIHLLDDDTAIGNRPARNNLEVTNLVSRLRSAMCFNIATDNIDAGCFQPASFIQHRPGLTDTRGRAEEDVQRSSARFGVDDARLGSQPLQHLLGRRPPRFTRRWHRVLQIVQREVELEDVHSRFTQHTKIATFRVAIDQRANLIFAHATLAGNPRHLVLGGSR